jgi:GTP-binding protein
VFVDEVEVVVRGGKGGNGCRSMRREKYIPRGGPDGGNGGRGGDVVMVAEGGTNTLAAFTRRRHFFGQPGQNGSGNDRYGRGGEDLVVKVPVGTLVKTGDGEVLADLLLAGETFRAAKGGRGGRGNARLVTPVNPLPNYAEKGEPGEERTLRLELKLLADVGLVGLPNAGKSTLISRLSAARPKIAAYPFTTLSPSLGVVAIDHSRHFVMADIPGLIEGAHEGKGLGIRFLRHIERTRLILHLLDVSGFEGRDPAADYKAIRAELASYSPHLAKKPELVVATKLDVPGAEAIVKKVARKLRKKPVPISAVTGQGLDGLVKQVAAQLAKLPHEVPREKVVHRVSLEPDFHIEPAGEGRFLVRGGRVEKLVAMTNLDNDEAVEVLGRKLGAMGLEDELAAAGAEEGDTVRIGEYEFTFEPE